MSIHALLRNFHVPLSLIVLALQGTLVSAAGPKTLLFYGNSFTRGYGSAEAEAFGGVPEVVRQLAIAAGFPAPRVENAAVNNQSLAWHLSNNTAVITNPLDFQEVPDFQWDAVIIQEFSTKPTSIGDPAAFRADAVTMLGTVRNHSPAARAVLYQTWARAPGHSFYTGNPPQFPGGPAQMQQELRNNYELARQDLIAAYGPGTAKVARVGDAWESTGWWENLYSEDLYHASAHGTYLAGLVIFGILYDQYTTVGLPKLFNSLTAQDAAALQAVADLFLPPPSPYDLNTDGSIDQNDFALFRACATGPSVPYQPATLPQPPPGCSLTPKAGGYIAADFDTDGDVDQTDFGILQLNLTYRPPVLYYETWDMVLSVTAGSGTHTLSNRVTTSNNTTPAVALAAVTIPNQTVPTWLTVPPAVNAGTSFNVGVNVTGLPVGTYFARINASAANYEGASANVILEVTPSPLNQVLWFDFGGADAQAAIPYNNVTPAQAPVVNAIDGLGFPTGISLTITDAFWPGWNSNGTTTPAGDGAIFDSLATRDSLFGNTADFGGITEPTAAFTLSGLNTAPGVSYTFTFFASRMGASDNRQTMYQVTGSNSGTAYLNVANNQTEVAVVSGIVPTPQGTIVVSLGPGPSNNNPFGFYYIGAMRVIRNTP